MGRKIPKPAPPHPTLQFNEDKEKTSLLDEQYCYKSIGKIKDQLLEPRRAMWRYSNAAPRKLWEALFAPRVFDALVRPRTSSLAHPHPGRRDWNASTETNLRTNQQMSIKSPLPLVPNLHIKI